MILAGLLINKNTPNEIIIQILKLQPGLGIKVLQNPNAPKEIIELAYFNTNVSERHEFVLEKTVNVYALSLLSKEDDEEDRALASEHPELPVEIMSQLVNDPSREVREGLLYNDNVTSQILKILSQDEDDDIKTVALQYLKQRGIQESFGRLAKIFQKGF